MKLYSIAIGLTFLFSSIAFADDSVSYLQDVAPVLRKNCVACHHDKKPEGGLSLETVKAMIRGGDSGPAVVPGSAKQSLILQRVRGPDDLVMPPADNTVAAMPLNEESIEKLSRWINAGAKADRPNNASQSAGKEKSQDVQLDPSIRFSYGLGLILDPTATTSSIAIFSRGNELWMAENSTMQNEADNEEVKRSHLLVAHAHSDIIDAMAVSPDGTWLATGSRSEIILWSITHQDNLSLTNLLTLARSSFREIGGNSWLAERVTSLDISEDSRFLAIGSGQTSRTGTVAIVRWEAPTATLNFLFPEVHTDAVCAVAFSPDGRSLLTAGAQ